ncbi:hypothetical protein BG53_12735 [Paenibacillus darwinianus]|uniref:Uncharacterized protein n=1 Tax=Paenibacillus darwinianus TaxID=1380763 RepID=A0A9W5W8G2_9BACL|nr:hypothetical protein [Paenibacillus darwinianus]EXX86065.1 hypothetical protein CH50_07945 [Paenibacillus darwinianus]EXX86376.1 hypothetical protein BG52_06655 [Paenibacillus darwinianus]EXX90879.1 hypothetical protein BG53_12735 [Paenibacillus darwinianus]
MYKLLLLTMLSVVWMMMQTLQFDGELAMRTLFYGKHAVNRAVHAAAQRLDMEALANGVVRIDPQAAEAAALAYLQANLRIDRNGVPLPGTRLRDRVEVLVFRIVNEGEFFPYTYRNEAYDYEVTLRKPGVVLIVRVRNPRVFAMLEPIEWAIKGAAETVAAV